MARRIVWVVDDSRLDVERARRLLIRDYEVESFQDGSTALERLSAGATPDVMVLDWVMPGVSGLDVCRFLRSADVSTQKIGILLLTVHRDTEQIVEGLSAGANDYLAKPYEDEELRARVASLIRTRELVDRLEHAQAQNRRLLETAPDPLLVCDEDGHLTFVNEQAVHVFAMRREQLLGCELAELVPELRLERTESGASTSLLPAVDVTIGARRFSPTLRTLVEGNSTRLVVSLRDVTERRQVEERRLDFYSIIAHDLRTPLHAMTLRITNMLHNSRTKPGLSLTQDLEKLDLRLHSLVEMINDFLDLASLEGAASRIEHAEIDLAVLLERAREELTPLLEKNAQSYRGPDVACPVVVHGDERRLLQVLTNLLSNAIKFTPREGHIAADLRVEERHVELAIRDSGVGIAPAFQATLFQRYTRAEQKVGGTGLGLLIVREIIEAHGGEVGVESIEGTGSRFWFRLPRAARVER